MKLLDEAAQDLRYLLNRGYRKKVALKFVANHYLLDKSRRNHLSRLVFSKTVSEKRKRKIVDLKDLKGETVFIDGYNVLITIETILKNPEDVFLADDGFIRDRAGVFGKYKIDEYTDGALDHLLKLLNDPDPASIKFYFDKQVSFSGELGLKVKNLLNKKNISGEVILSANVDYDLVNDCKKNRGIAVTSDGVIIDQLYRSIDLSRLILDKLS